MKSRKFIFTSLIAIAATIFISPLYAQESQNVGVKIPFAFKAAGRTLPAGHYLIGSANDNRIVWTIRGASDQPAHFLLAMTREGNPGEDPIVTFRQYGDRYFLAGFRTASYSISLPVSDTERKTRLAAGPLADMQVEVKAETLPPAAGDGLHD